MDIKATAAACQSASSMHVARNDAMMLRDLMLQTAPSHPPCPAFGCILGWPPDLASADDLPNFQSNQYEGGASAATINSAVSVRRFSRLLRAKRARRHAASIRYRMMFAKLPIVKDLDAFVFDGTPASGELWAASFKACCHAATNC